MESKYSLPYDGGIIMDGTPQDIIHRYEKIPTTIFSTESNGAEVGIFVLYKGAGNTLFTGKG